MDNSSLLTIFNTAFVVCLTLTILFFIAAVALFFIFKIPDVQAELSGKAREKALKKMGANSTENQHIIGEGLSGTLDTETSGLTLTGKLPVTGKKTGHITAQSAPLDTGRMRRTGNNSFNIKKEVLLIHTDETI